eukprot:scaffold3648_cov149-Amphora_coffeaeformis.AAC.12
MRHKHAIIRAKVNPNEGRKRADDVVGYCTDDVPFKKIYEPELDAISLCGDASLLHRLRPWLGEVAFPSPTDVSLT